MMKTESQFQTRSEENGIKYYNVLDGALAAARKDPSIWKISFYALSEERIRLVRSNVPEAEFPVFILVQLKDEIATEIEKLTGVDGASYVDDTEFTAVIFDEATDVPAELWEKLDKL